MERKRKKTPSREQIDAIRGRESIERWERAKRMFEERLEYHARRKVEEEQQSGA